jgi:uroporphyrinogen-III decarboxylase
VKAKTEWKTPVGTIAQTLTYLPQSYTWAHTEYPVKTPDDLKVVSFILEHQEVKPNYDEQNKQTKLFGEWGAEHSYAGKSPMAKLFSEWMGAVNTIYAIADAPKEIEKTLEVFAKSDDSIYEIVCNSSAPLVGLGENITSEIISPKIFEKYYVPYYRKRSEQVHKAGKHLIIHIDGTLRGVLPLISKSGIDSGQSLTPAPVGDVEVEEMRELAGPDLILMGGVPAVFFSPIYPEKDLREIVMRCLDYYRNDGKFILCACDQVPPDAEIQRVKIVSELVEEYGRTK